MKDLILDTFSQVVSLMKIVKIWGNISLWEFAVSASLIDLVIINPFLSRFRKEDDN